MRYKRSAAETSRSGGRLQICSYTDFSKRFTEILASQSGMETFVSIRRRPTACPSCSEWTVGDPSASHRALRALITTSSLDVKNQFGSGLRVFFCLLMLLRPAIEVSMVTNVPTFVCWKPSICLIVVVNGTFPIVSVIALL